MGHSQFIAGGSFDVFWPSQDLTLVVKSPKVAQVRHTWAADCQSRYTTVAYRLAQFNFEFLFDCLEELNDVSAGEQPAQESRLVIVDFLSVSLTLLAYKQVREGWAWVLALSLPQGENSYFKTAASKGSGGG